jgi:hypothetical protein
MTMTMLFSQTADLWSYHSLPDSSSSSTQRDARHEGYSPCTTPTSYLLFVLLLYCILYKLDYSEKIER